jgi:hypothetical protein
LPPDRDLDGNRGENLATSRRTGILIIATLEAAICKTFTLLSKVILGGAYFAAVRTSACLARAEISGMARYFLFFSGCGAKYPCLDPHRRFPAG